MKQTGPIKKLLVRVVERMHADTFKNPDNQIKLGFQQKYDAVISLGYEIDNEKISFMKA
jgi:hypothetical protein